MKTINKLVVGLVTVVVLQACTPKMAFVSSTVVPAATGTIDIKKDKNSNYLLNVNVSNLAPSKNLSPSKKVYLVWMDADDKSVKKLGQLNPSGKALKGSMRATAVNKPDDVFITAEDDPEISYPSGDIVLTTKK